MADGNYDEVTNTVYQGESRENIDPMFHWDMHFPERISRLRLNAEFSSPASRRQRRPRDRCAARYKTQPITFDEITEVDEDTSGAASGAAAAAAAAATSAVVQSESPEITAEMKINFKNTMTGFSRSMDGLVASGSGPPTKRGGTGSDKENTPCEGDRLARPQADQPPGAEAGGARASTERDHRGVGASTSAAPVECFRSVGCPLDGVRHRRKKMNRKLHHRNTVEEVPETEKVEETTETAA